MKTARSGGVNDYLPAQWQRAREVMLRMLKQIPETK
jgi:hypothetical protein